MKTKRYCSPGKGDHISCTPKPILKKIARILNKQPECSKINVSCNPDKLYMQIQKEIKNISDCNKEPCWLQVKELKENLSPNDYRELKDSFRPEKPASWKKNKNEWLTTDNIDNVMKQYEKAHPSFKYSGAIPIDFNLKDNDGKCKVNELCQLNISELMDQGKKSIGIVFNVDPHTKGGQHWFTMYIDLVGMNQKNNPFIYYFDSIQGDIPDEIYHLISNIKNQFEVNYPSKEIGFTYNDIQHQYGTTECGIYCLHFLTEMLQGRSFNDYIDTNINDSGMEQFRDIFFV